MADDTLAPLLDQLAALDAATRREVAEGLRKVAETFAQDRGGKRTGHTSSANSVRS